MSHKTTLKTKLDNKKYILDALKAMDYKCTEAKKDQKLRTKSNYSGVATDVDILVHSAKGRSIKDAVGLKLQEDGTYSVTGDFWNTGLQEKKFMSDLQMQSKKLEVSDKLADMNFDLSDESVTNQKLELTFTRCM